MNRMREERAQMAVQVEEEEEQMTNMLMKRIAELESQVASLKDNEGGLDQQLRYFYFVAR